MACSNYKNRDVMQINKKYICNIFGLILSLLGLRALALPTLDEV